MKRFWHIAALSLALGASVHLPAAASPSASAHPADTPTYSQAFNRLGGASHAYSDGKGGLFLIYTRGDGHRLMFKMMSSLAQGRGILLPTFWKPPQGWLEVNKWEAISRLRTKPLAVSPLSPMPHDRYHPGVKLLARSGSN
jgi:hypothetical protein